jgi:hypothetical protein
MLYIDCWHYYIEGAEPPLAPPLAPPPYDLCFVRGGCKGTSCPALLAARMAGKLALLDCLAPLPCAPKAPSAPRVVGRSAALSLFHPPFMFFVLTKL